MAFSLTHSLMLIVLCALLVGCSRPVEFQGESPAVYQEDPYDIKDDPCGSDAEAHFLTLVNQVRAGAGVPPLKCLNELSRMARSHAKYLSRHKDLGLTHVQDQGRSGFSGETLDQRARAFHVDRQAFWISESLGGGSKVRGSFARQIGSVYHRAPLLSPGTKYLGFEAPVMNALTWIAPALDLVGVYPYDGSDHIPTSLDSNGEEPDPDRDRGVVGYPISFHFPRHLNDKSGSESIATVLGTEIYLDGELVEHRVLTHNSDAHVSPADVFLVPLEPLQPESTYFVVARINYGSQTYQRSHRFRTR